MGFNSSQQITGLFSQQCSHLDRETDIATTRIIRLAHIGVGQKGWIYSGEGLICTLPATQYKDPPKIIVTNISRNKNEQNNSNRKHKR